MSNVRKTLVEVAVALIVGLSSAAYAQNATVVAGPIPQKIKSDSAQIWWATDKPAAMIIRYGTDPNVMANRVKGEAKTSQEVDLNGLRPNTTYYVAVARPNGTMLQRGIFKTQPPNYNPQSQKIAITDGPVLEQIAPDNAIIAWSTNVPSSTVVHYGTDIHVMAHKAEGKTEGPTHRVLIKDLQHNTRYWFKVESGKAGAVAQSLILQFKTEAPGQAALSMPQPH